MISFNAKAWEYEQTTGTISVRNNFVNIRPKTEDLERNSHEFFMPVHIYGITESKAAIRFESSVVSR